ncbi:MAG: UDP-glucose 4-epimerase GalE [Verrucomicrobia bacterium 21-51-4]|nr:MAG: UDP-glucose 4-epimerase GalE [Verrucomicrobia bacterium 21-51-4]HQU09303.1 UDP-glucose 4-epimerase GalE [Opitutales bacterium]
MNILVVGGAGYIGSHCVRQLIVHGHHPVVLDNLAYGHIEALPADTAFYNADLGDQDTVKAILTQEKIDIVMHFAAFAYVGESVTNPIKYYNNNLIGTLRLLEAMIEVGVKKFVFSSTCATYGIPDALPITEGTPQRPINPYGQTKLDVENALRAYARAYGLSFAAFRYFNAAGAAADGKIGEDHNPETHLIPDIFKVALGQDPHIEIYGDDYPTEDGTCLRDYIHVEDLSSAHILVFDHLNTPGTQLFFNLGTGTPHSVLEIIRTAEAVIGQKIAMKIAPRRAGDPPALYADASLAKKTLGWRVQYPDIHSIIETAWRWHKSHPNGFKNPAPHLS